MGAWWWRRQRARAGSGPALERGTTILFNTPTAIELSAEGVI
jgi:hypothetical protein